MARARRSARLGRADNRARRRGAPRGFRAYTGTVSVLGVLACVLLTIGGSGVPSDDWRYWLFAALVLAGELAPIDVPRRGGFDRVTMSTAFAFAILLIFGLLPAVVAYAAASAVADAVARVSPLKLVFNAAQYVLSLVAAAGVMALVSDGVPVEALGTALRHRARGRRRVLRRQPRPRRRRRGAARRGARSLVTSWPTSASRL